MVSVPGGRDARIAKETGTEAPTRPVLPDAAVLDALQSLGAEPGLLSPEEQRSLDEQGFVCLGQLLTPEQARPRRVACAVSPGFCGGLKAFRSQLPAVRGDATAYQGAAAARRRDGGERGQRAGYPACIIITHSCAGELRSAMVQTRS